MNDLEHWHKSNEQYLKAALTWLRLSLLQFAEPENVSPSAEEDLKKAAATMAVAEATNPPPAMVILGQRLGLSHFEQQVLLLCTAIELDIRIASLCARVQEDLHRPYPTFALALTLFEEASWDVLSPERPLRYWRLIEINQPAAQPLTTSALRADERIVNFLKGLNYLDDRLAPLLIPLEAASSQEQLPPSQQSLVNSIINNLQKPAARHNPPVIQLLGSDVASKQLVASHCAQALGLYLYRIPVQLLPAQTADLETFVRLWQRESLLLPIALYIDARELEGGQTSTLYRFILRSQGVIFLDTRDIQLELNRPTLPVDIAKPKPTEQQAAWLQFLGTASSKSSALLAGQFNLSLTAIEQIALNELQKTSNDSGSLHKRVWEACLVYTRPQLDALARRVESKATWDDIVLPQEAMDLLRQTANQVQQRSIVYENWGFHRQMNRGLGISALFAGESGTGKTMAAEVIANDLQLNLYRIDLSAVVSKYIGETEKNLRRLFDAAEDGGAILFFDEADALFGKRSEVKDSHDRYANIEINYLLQRMEAYRGLAILATNMKSALDTAFMRRLRFIIDFPFPSIAERKGIWQRVFPPETPTTDLDCDRLARLNLTGGSIHNIALNAAFLAAREGTPVTMPLILNAARTELRKLEKPINEADFRYSPLTN
ncbi:ATP-binding protein [Iningainema tapete]|uniref:ATP-binding protein n=1 Tax=Iningainema tapete BLCC-T55 TaxID=2748662 RepID=A0A8J6XDL1_9CYAN|nr:ATP-binding protein [Iningainema tapete]MBD2773379.1 ATP-binding protein [Iningainema tapete BLCC-T55]